jgi:hypothetical protein
MRHLRAPSVDARPDQHSLVRGNIAWCRRAGVHLFRSGQWGTPAEPLLRYRQTCLTASRSDSKITFQDASGVVISDIE